MMTLLCILCPVIITQVCRLDISQNSACAIPHLWLDTIKVRFKVMLSPKVITVSGYSDMMSLY